MAESESNLQAVFLEHRLFSSVDSAKPRDILPGILFVQL